jgi:hypothetical protein
MPDDINTILIQRASSHGDYLDHARITQSIEIILRAGPKYERLDYCQMESLHMIAHKMARIVCGNPNHIDHWNDIIGYAKLIVDQLSVNVKD